VLDHLLLVEDHGLLAHTLATALQSFGLEAEVVDTTTVDDLLADLQARAPALVLLDLDLGRHGDATRLIAPLVRSGCLVVMLTGSEDAIAHARCLAEGAAGVLGKDLDLEDLLAAVERVRATGRLIDPHVREEHLALLRSHERERADRLAPFERLTPREAQVLGALMRGETVDQIARRAVVSVATVRTQVKAIRTKLGVSSQVAAIGRALEVGWQPPDQRGARG
jgi:two-component system, NarL family, nitrate/nitrite response regulator NarL